jgi:hypothetical protein
MSDYEMIQNKTVYLSDDSCNGSMNDFYCFDENSQTYPRELHIACQIYSEAIKDYSEKKGTPKQVIEKIIAEKGIMNQNMCDRLTVICNWTKRPIFIDKGKK